MSSFNLAARAGRWSADNWKKAFFGWLVFVLPAAMKLLGDWNWYLPRWLEWLPSLSAEGTPAEKAPEAPAVPTAN